MTGRSCKTTDAACPARSPLALLIAATLWTVVICGFLGCGGPADVAPARGTVQLDGKPCVAGRVIMRPLQDGRSSIGMIEPDGTFEMRLSPGQAGAQVGVNHLLVIEAKTGEAEDSRDFRGPESARVTVEPRTDNEFSIRISRELGWIPIQD